MPAYATLSGTPCSAQRDTISNDGHLIRVVGPSFDLVSRWAARGIPIKIAYEGIDRYFERYYRSGPRRRPVKIDFCEADVLDVFDEWRRATGITTSADSAIPTHDQRRESLPAHLERVLIRLTAARASGRIGAELDALIDRVSRELDLVRSKPGGLRGDARRALLDRLAQMDADMMATVRGDVEPDVLTALSADADDEIRPFRAGMAAEIYARTREAAIARLIRQKFNLPIILFS